MRTQATTVRKSTTKTTWGEATSGDRKNGGDSYRNERIELGDRARQARLRMGFTQKDVADRVGYSQALVSQVERIGFPNESYLGKFEDILGSLSDSDDDGASAPSGLGAWLNRMRVKRDLSPAQLADRAGISLAQLYNLESGRSVNPRPETLKKLQKVLRTEVPTEFVKEIEKDSDFSQINGVGRFVSFDPHDESQFPSDPGVYVIYDVTQRPIYVGQAGEIKRRIKAHSEKKWFGLHPIRETRELGAVQTANPSQLSFPAPPSVNVTLPAVSHTHPLHVGGVSACPEYSRARKP